MLCYKPGNVEIHCKEKITNQNICNSSCTIYILESLLFHNLNLSTLNNWKKSNIFNFSFFLAPNINLNTLKMYSLLDAELKYIKHSIKLTLIPLNLLIDSIKF